MFVCGLCKPQREREGPGPAPAAGQAAAYAAPLAGPSLQSLTRSKSELRVLQLADAGSQQPHFYRSQSMPVGLLGASRRRLEGTERQEEAAEREQQLKADSEAATSFVQKYMGAIKDGNGSWASDPSVGALFLEDARMVSTDGQSFHGRAAILRRLNSGVEALARAAGGSSGGEAQQLPTFEIEGPSGGGAAGAPLVLTLRLRRGLHKVAFVLSFTMQQGRIAVLQNTRA